MHSLRTSRRCRSLVICIRSRRSERPLAMQRSAIAFARGDRTGVLITRVPLPEKTSSNTAVNLLSRSRIRNLNRPARSPRSISRLRPCRAVYSPVVCVVTPRMCTARVWNTLRRPAGRRANYRGQLHHQLEASMLAMSRQTFIFAAAPARDYDLMRVIEGRARRVIQERRGQRPLCPGREHRGLPGRT
jgi:hypothetical protein